LHMIFLLGASRAQQSTKPRQPPATAEPVVGTWKLNFDKSTNPPAASELITIVSQRSDFKLTFDLKQDNSNNENFEVVTDMKGPHRQAYIRRR
jgi:hypothetical protein